MNDKADKKVYASGYYDIPKDQMEYVIPAMLENIELSRLEEGNLQYDYRYDETVEGRVHLSEIFKNQKALDAHMARVAKSRWAEISKDVKRTFQVRTEE